MPYQLNASSNMGTASPSSPPNLDIPHSELDEKSEGLFLQTVARSGSEPSLESNLESRVFSTLQNDEENPPCGSETIGTSIDDTKNSIGRFTPFFERLNPSSQNGNPQQSAQPHLRQPPKVPFKGSSCRRPMDWPTPIQAAPPIPPQRRFPPTPLNSPLSESSPLAFSPAFTHPENKKNSSDPKGKEEEKFSASSESPRLTASELENWTYMKRPKGPFSPWSPSPSTPSLSSPVSQRNRLNRDVKVSEEDFSQLMDFVRDHNPQQALTFLRERYPEQMAFVSEHGSDIANGIAMTISVGALATALPTIGPGLLACGVGGIIAGGTGIAAGKLREHPSCPNHMRRPLAGLQIAASATSLLLLSFTGAIGGGAPALVGSVLDATNTGLTVATSVPGLLVDDTEPSNE